MDAKRLATEIKRTATVLRIKRDALAAADEQMRSKRPVMVVPQRHLKLLVRFLVKRR
jgi:hypothetical protein